MLGWCNARGFELVYGHDGYQTVWQRSARSGFYRRQSEVTILQHFSVLIPLHALNIELLYCDSFE